MVALLIAGLALIAQSDALHGLMLRLTAIVTPLMERSPLLGGSAFVVVSALSAMLAFFSGAVLVPVAVQVWGSVLTTLLLWLGWLLGGVSAYALARYAGRPLVQRVLRPETLAAYETKVGTHASIGLVLLLQLGLPSEVPGYLLGLVRYSIGRYVLVLALAELPWAVLTVLLGSTLLERRVPLLVLVGVLATLLSGLAVIALHRRLRSDT
jgi:uncharacterized membrane protein YdjX (TVP38/TMEM64 family)